ncbi:MAG: 2,4'-dihydroxyacetophenone dioxygenase family protein [Acidobacteria bacterium]|nr:2,4'-dihydroxyacetophenone dioxygenase family protein [Acidobacteriota bacterium]
MADGDTGKSMEEKFADYAAKVAARGTFPVWDDAPTQLVKDDDLPWAEAPDGSAIKLLHVDLNQGLWVSLTRLPPDHKVIKHFHTGFVYAVTLQGKWFYEETPEAVSESGSYLFEPAGSTHTLCTPDDVEGDTIVWFAIYGANINLDEAGNVVSVVDARAALEMYRVYCDAVGFDCSKLIVQGE